MSFTWNRYTALVVVLAVLAVTDCLWCALRDSHRRAGGEGGVVRLPVVPSESAVAPAPRAREGRRPSEEKLAEMTRMMDLLRPLHKKLAPPKPGDWLYHHPEKGQTFRQYVESDFVMPTEERGTIYVQPLGEFDEAQRKVISLTAEFLKLYFCLPVKVKADLSLDLVPASARRVHPSWGDRQILTSYVLDEVLAPRLPEDAAAYIAFTTSDLWPGEGWNFVFGQASLSERVAVWSIYRNGDPHDDAEFALCLLRTMKMASHETGHMFSMLHCTAHKCNMCGVNSREESDGSPLALCPECLAKVVWITGADPAKRYRALAEFCRRVGLKKEAETYERLLGTLGGE